MGRKSENKEIILNRTSHLFWTQGFEAVGVADICKTAEVNKGTLYHFFKTKDDLAVAIMEEGARHTQAHCESLLQLPPNERLSTYLQNIRIAQKKEMDTSSYFPGCPFGNMGIEMTSKNEAIRQGVLACFRIVVGFIEGALRDLALETPKAKNLAREIFTYWEGAFLMSKIHNSFAPFDSIERITFQMIEAAKSP